MLLGSPSPRQYSMNLCFVHHRRRCQSAQPSLPESEYLQRELERGVGPLPLRLNAGFLPAVTSEFKGAGTRAQRATAVVNALALFRRMNEM